MVFPKYFAYEKDILGSDGSAKKVYVLRPGLWTKLSSAIGCFGSMCWPERKSFDTLTSLYEYLQDLPSRTKSLPGDVSVETEDIVFNRLSFWQPATSFLTRYAGNRETIHRTPIGHLESWEKVVTRKSLEKAASDLALSA